MDTCCCCHWLLLVLVRMAVVVPVLALAPGLVTMQIMERALAFLLPTHTGKPWSGSLHMIRWKRSKEQQKLPSNMTYTSEK